MVFSQNIKNIVLDFGGVILNIDYQAPAGYLISKGFSDFEKIYNQASQISLFDNLETGKASEEDFCRFFNQHTGMPDNEIIYAWNTLILDLPAHRIEMIKHLSKKYRVFLLSNTNIIHYKVYTAMLKAQYGYNSWDELFEKAWFSFDLGMRKPDMEIYQFVQEAASLTPSETLFIDDTIQNLNEPRVLGWNTFFLEKGKDVVEILKP
ncbi:MAG: HAD family phosphatase [Bacteroidetes bacterium]|nr:HAD family phosphatase [Bacteroidota bacterium]